jgi:hypothetical protein
VVVVPVMDGQLPQFFATEFPSTPRTEPGIQLQRLRPIRLLPLGLVATCLGYNLILLLVIC